MKKINLFIFLVLGVFIFNEQVYAATYTPTENLFSITQSDNLLDMANNQVDNFYSKKFVLFQVDDNYYLVVGDDYTTTETSITFTNSTIFSAIRNSEGGYYSNYNYSISTETSTRVNLNYIVISNIEVKNAVSSDKFNDISFKNYLINLAIFILAFVFGIFITKEGRF